MIDLIEILNKKYDSKYSYLKIYEVSYDKSSLECVLTFLYPHEISDIGKEDREKIQNTVKETLNLNGNLVVKFKKSFLDERLIQKQVFDFITSNFKAGAVYIEENQICVESGSVYIKVKINVAEEIKKYFESVNLSLKLNNFLSEKFISDFDIEILADKNFLVSSEIGNIEVPTILKKNMRYDVFIVNSLIGGEIAPKPEFIKDNKEPKSSVILAGVISQFQKKSFIRKKGKRAGEEGVYYTFTLDDDKKVDCVYFCAKSNITKMDNLTDGMTILCLGDLKSGLSNKLTYYISRIAIANIDEDSKKPKSEKAIKKHIPVVIPEEFVALKQDDIFAKSPVYNDYIMNNTFVVYDLETTGIDPASDRIVEIGAVKIENGRVTQKFASFVNPEMHIPEEASRVNNITDQMVADAPKINDVIIDFLNFTDNCIISGYNNINFDNKFINKLSKEYNLPFNNENIDVYNLVRQMHVKSKNYKLTTVVEAMGLSLEGAHRAYNDAYATAQVLLKLNEVQNS